MKKIFLFALFLSLFVPSAPRAELSIDITGAHSEPMATGLPVFRPAAPPPAKWPGKSAG